MTDEEREKILAECLKGTMEAIKKVAEECLDKVYIDYLPYVLNDTEANARIIAEAAIIHWMNGCPDKNIPLTAYFIERIALEIYKIVGDKINDPVIKAQAQKIKDLEYRLSISVI